MVSFYVEANRLSGPEGPEAAQGKEGSRCGNGLGWQASAPALSEVNPKGLRGTL